MHLLTQIYHHGGEKSISSPRGASSILYPPQKAALCLKSKVGRTTNTAGADPGKANSTRHWVQISTQMTFFANLAHSHIANGLCLHCSERRTVLMNSLIKRVSFLFSIFPLSNMVKIFPAVWKWLAGRGRELLTLLRAFSIWRKWPLLILLSNRADHPLEIKETLPAQ